MLWSCQATAGPLRTTPAVIVGDVAAGTSLSPPADLAVEQLSLGLALVCMRKELGDLPAKLLGALGVLASGGVLDQPERCLQLARGAVECLSVVVRSCGHVSGLRGMMMQ